MPKPENNARDGQSEDAIREWEPLPKPDENADADGARLGRDLARVGGQCRYCYG